VLPHFERKRKREKEGKEERKRKKEEEEASMTYGVDFIWNYNCKYLDSAR